MTQIATITINDGKATPLAHVFDPNFVQGESASLHNRAPSNILGYEAMTVRVQAPKGNEQYGRVVARLQLPVMEVTAGSTGSGLQAAPTKAYDNFIEVSARFHRRSTLAERKDARVLLTNLLANAAIVAALDKMEPVF